MLGKPISFKNPSKKSLKAKLNLKSSFTPARATVSQIPSTSLPDLLPFLPKTTSPHNFTASVMKHFVISAPISLADEGVQDSALGSANGDLCGLDDESGELMDEFHPMGDVSNKRVRLVRLDHITNLGYYGQPHNKKVREDYWPVLVNSTPASASNSSMGISVLESGDDDLSDDGISTASCLEETQGLLRKK